MQRKLTAENLLMALAFWRSDTIGYTDLAAQLSQQAKVTTSHQSEEIGMIKWFRRLETFLPEIRTCIQKGRWLALAKLIKKIATEWCKPQKQLRNTSWQKFNHAKAAETLV